MTSKKKIIAIFASGNGTNAEKLAGYFMNHPEATVRLLLCNRRDAMVLERFNRLRIPTVTFSREEFSDAAFLLSVLKEFEVDLIVLAGFLWLVPAPIIQAYPSRIINIHPALLPKFGGKGMYGEKVHEAVLAAGEKESGITIHYVNEAYDEGSVIFQARIQVLPGDTSDRLAARIHELEYRHFPQVVEKLISMA
ncbi:MAG: phosphoribosylglycinamide formyltransferase [Bacteroidetes bacterium]|nr:phosphoribosylglycinamide formyltransferase [Bacteroidota bacterium]